MNRFKIPLYVAIGVFLTCLGFIFISEKNHLNQMILVVAGSYGLVCFAFLLFQLYAFVRAHTHYDEDVERVKFQVFEAENVLPEEGP